jgi:hypothetical protein
MFQGHPTEAQLETVMLDAGYSTVLVQQSDQSGKVSVPLAKAISLYVETRSFAQVASRFGVHRPEIRRNFRRIADALQESNNPTHQGVGAWMQLLIEKMSATGSGYTQRATTKMQGVGRSDPEVLGNFRVSITDEHFGHWFRGKAVR